MRAWRSLSRHYETCYNNKRCNVVQLHSRACSTLPRSEVAVAREEKAQNEAWAKQPGAREVLAQPPFVVGGQGKGASPAPADALDSLDNYLQVRLLILFAYVWQKSLGRIVVVVSYFTRRGYRSVLYMLSQRRVVFWHARPLNF